MSVWLYQINTTRGLGFEPWVWRISWERHLEWAWQCDLDLVEGSSVCFTGKVLCQLSVRLNLFVSFYYLT